MRNPQSLWQYAKSKGTDIFLLGRAYVRLGLIDLSLRQHGFQAAIHKVEAEALPRNDAVTPRDLRRAQRYARRIDQSARFHLVRARCLHRSLALHGWLREEGLPSVLRIGVTKEGPELKAHAWVELVGRVVNDQDSAVAVFTPLSDGGKQTQLSRGATGKTLSDTFLGLSR